MTAKNPPLRDRKYLDYLRTQRCIISGVEATQLRGNDPMHIGTAGRGLKAGDDEALPVLHYFHSQAHERGEMTMFREHLPDAVLRAALRAYARSLYAEWKARERQSLNKGERVMREGFGG